MKRMLVFLLTAGLLVAFSTTALAEFCDRYWSDPNPPTDQINPVWWEADGSWKWHTPADADTAGPWFYGPDRYDRANHNATKNLPIPPPPAIPDGESMYFGHENLFVETNAKILTLIIDYTGGDLDLTGFGMGWRAGAKVATEKDVREVADTDDLLYIKILIVPQPSWEWVEITNNGPGAATINSVEFYTQCDPIPSLTEWGMVGLVVLMLAAGTMVIVRRRRATAVA